MSEPVWRRLIDGGKPREQVDRPEPTDHDLLTQIARDLSQIRLYTGFVALVVLLGVLEHLLRLL